MGVFGTFGSPHGRLDCISFNYAKNPHLESNLSKIRDTIINQTGDKGAQFLRKDINGKLAVNYLSIDACVEGYRVRSELYQNKYQLVEALKTEEHNITFGASESNIHVAENRADKIDKPALVNSIINKVVGADIEELREQLKSYNLNYIERTIMETYVEYSPYIERSDIITILQTLSLRDSKKFKNLKTAANFVTLNDNNNFKVQLNRYFKTGSSFTREKLLEKWKGVIAETGLGINTKSLTENAVVHLTKLYFKTTKRRDTPKGDSIELKITGTNPKGFTLLKQRKDPSEKPKFYTIFS